MARKINDIKKELTDDFVANTTIQAAYGLDPQQSFEAQFSKVSIESIFFSVVAVSQWALEKLFDLHKQEVVGLIDNMKPHSLRWYANMAKAFQFGRELLEDEDYYDNTDLSDEQIEAEQIVSYAAVVEQKKNLRVKVAKDVGEALGPLETAEKTAFDEYMNRIKDAGVKLEITSGAADRLVLSVDVYYDPLVLNSDGVNLIEGNRPVHEAIQEYLKNLPFNGTLVLAYLTDALQEVPGVVIPEIKSAEAYYGANIGGQFGVMYNPDAGYLTLDEEEDLDITFIAQSVIK